MSTRFCLHGRSPCTPISTNILINGEVSFTDTPTTGIAKRYYRAVAR